MFKNPFIWRISQDGKFALHAKSKVSPFQRDMRFLQKRGLKVAAIQIGRL